MRPIRFDTAPVVGIQTQTAEEDSLRGKENATASGHEEVGKQSQTKTTCSESEAERERERSERSETDQSLREIVGEHDEAQTS